MTLSHGKVPLQSPSEPTEPTGTVRKYATAVQPGKSEYRIVHNLGTENVIVQTRIAGRVREGGVSIVDADTVQLTFGGTLNETMDVVIIG